MSIFELPKTPSVVEIVTEYHFPEGYQPEVIELYATKFPRRIVSTVKVTESAASDWHQVEVFGRRLTKDGVIRQGSGGRILVGFKVDDALYAQHVARSARSTCPCR
jgi:hypothetical protein